MDDALKILSDVAYGRVSILNLTVLDTGGNPIPDVAVALDTTPNIVDGPLTDENGTLTINTSGGSHTVNLAYPLGYSAETGSQAIEVSGVRDLTVQAVSRKNTSEILHFPRLRAIFALQGFCPRSKFAFLVAVDLAVLCVRIKINPLAVDKEALVDTQ